MKPCQHQTQIQVMTSFCKSYELQLFHNHLDFSIWNGMFAKARPVKGDPVSVLLNVHCFYPPCEEPPLPLCVQACCREGGGGSKKKETIMSGSVLTCHRCTHNQQSREFIWYVLVRREVCHCDLRWQDNALLTLPKPTPQFRSPHTTYLMLPRLFPLPIAAVVFPYMYGGGQQYPISSFVPSALILPLPELPLPELASNSACFQSCSAWVQGQFPGQPPPYLHIESNQVVNPGDMCSVVEWSCNGTSLQCLGGPVAVSAWPCSSCSP